MWIMTNKGFISVVQDKFNSDVAIVRARRKNDLINIFPEKKNEIIILEDSDYKYRIKIKFEELTKIITKEIEMINYPNFKNSVEDPILEDKYCDVWRIMLDYQL